MSPPTSAAVPITKPIAEASPLPVPAIPSTTTGRYGRLIWLARNDTPKIRKMRRTVGSLRTPRIAPNASVRMRPSGTTSGLTSRDPKVTRSAVPTDSAAESQKTIGSDQPKPSMSRPASAGPDAMPTAVDAPNTPMTVPSRARGVTSRMPASITPVLPSWNPMSSMLAASCHGSRDRATPAKTTASTMALLTITALRLYLSAQTPHSGTSGAPTTKTRVLKMPMKVSRASPVTPSSSRRAGSRAKIWLTPNDSISETTKYTANRPRHAAVPSRTTSSGPFLAARLLVLARTRRAVCGARSRFRRPKEDA